MCERWDLPRGFSRKGERHKIGLRVMEFFRGFFANPSSSSLDSKQNREGLPPAALVANGVGAPGDEKLN
jgi:hypothetical protein